MSEQEPLWQQQSFLPDTEEVHQPAHAETQPAKKQRRAKSPDQKLRAALSQYLDRDRLRQLASDHERLEDALRTGDIPEEVSLLLDLLQTVLKPSERYQIRSPSDVAAYLQVRMGHQCQEQLCVLCLNAKNKLQKVHTVYQGNVNSAMIRLAEVFREPVRLNSTAIIVAHQHPSGDATPSPEDVTVSNEIHQAGVIFDIALHDSLIVTPHSYVSLAQRGFIPGPWKKS